MNSKQLKDILATVKNERRGGAPYDVWVQRNREILLMQVRNTTDASAKPGIVRTAGHLFSIFFPADGLRAVANAAAAFVLMVGVVIGGGVASAQVYGDALPGQFLYGVKLAVERAQLLLAPNDEYRARLHTEFADNRIDEFAALAESPEQHRIPAVLARFDAEVRSLQDGLDKLKVTDPDHVVEAAKLMERKMAVYQNILRKSSVSLSASAHVAVVRSQGLVDGATISAIAVIVEQHLAGPSDASRTIVVNRFEERIRQAEAKIAAEAEATEAAPSPRTEKAKEAIAEAKVLIEEGQYQAAMTKIAEVAELTKEEVEETPAAEESEAKTEEGAPGSETTEETIGEETAAPDAEAPQEQTEVKTEETPAEEQPAP